MFTRLDVWVLQAIGLTKTASRTTGSSQSPKPDLEDGTTYHLLRPTQLDKIKNLYVELRPKPIVGP